jgi:glycoprotein-N-acetylgalactosamine 3-beta-galactosyltransferase
MTSAIAETWGWKCDGFFAASTQTILPPPPSHNNNSSSSSRSTSTGTFDLTQPIAGLGSVDLPHLGPEQYNNMWQKTRSILAYMHDYYLNEFDFFFLSGDDTYVIVENLQRTLQSLGPAAWEYPLYLGHWIPFRPDSINNNNHNQNNMSSLSYFVGGGPGYVLNRKSLELLVQTALPTCHPTRLTSSEDRILGECFRSIGIMGNHSVDATMAQRFHGMDPHDTCTMKGESGFFGNLYRFWGSLYGFRTGFNLTSSQSVSFHRLTTAKHLKRIHAILYKSCPPNTTLGSILGSSSSLVRA